MKRLRLPAETLDGRGIYLREVQPSDVTDTYVSWLNDPEVNRYLETRHSPQTLGTVAQYVEATLEDDDQLFLAICLRENHAHIGNIKLGPVNRHHHCADISLFIGAKDSWGKGYATEAIGLLADHAFDAIGLNRLQAGCYAENEGSRKAFIKAGFTVEGTLKKRWLCGDTYQDGIVLGLWRGGRK